MIKDVDRLSNSFDGGILNMIKIHSYDVFIVNRIKNVKCTCVEHSTKQANIACEKCLGTGNKIKIRKIHCAAQDTKLPPTFRADTFMVARNYFIENKYIVNEEDIIVDRNGVYVIFEIQNLLSIKGTLPYMKANSTKKKYDLKIFLSNFNKIISQKH